MFRRDILIKRIEAKLAEKNKDSLFPKLHSTGLLALEVELETLEWVLEIKKEV